MVDGSGEGDDTEQLGDGHLGDRGGSVDTGLPVQPHHPQGGGRGSDLRYEAGPAAAHSPVRDEDGGGPDPDGQGNPQLPLYGDGGGLRAGNDGGGRDRAAIARYGLQKAREALRAKQSSVANGHRSPAGKAATGNSVARVRDRDAVQRAEQLTRVTDKALKKLEEILDLKIDRGSDTYAQDLKAITAMVDTALRTQLKVDENELRRQKVDLMPQLLETIKRVEKGMPKGKKVVTIDNTPLT